MRFFVGQVAHSNLTKLAAWKTQAALRSDKRGDLRSRTSHGLETGENKAWFHGSLLTLKEIERRPRQGAVVSTKSVNATPLAPAYDHPWRTYGKKINGKPVLTTLSTK